jgi:uncharacterized membrane protein YbhN (UPF0104 family)
VQALKKLARHLPALLGVGLLCGAIYVVQREFRHLKLADISAALGKIPNHALLAAAGLTIVSYGILTFYDRLGTYYAGRAVSYGRVAFASFCAYALSHNLGFAAVSGAAVRYRLYAHWGLTPLQIGKVVAFCSLTFGLGGMVLGGAILFVEPRTIPFFGNHLHPIVLRGIGVVMWAIVGAYVLCARYIGTVRVRGHRVELPSWKMAVVQVLLASVDVAATAAILYSLLPTMHGINYPRFLGVYLAAYSAGLAANLPGGLGVFDTAMLLGLSPYLDAPRIIGAIVVFRLYYYVIPLFLAGSMFAGNEIVLRSRGMLGRRAAASGAALAGAPIPLRGVQPAPGLGVLRFSETDFAVAAGTGAVALCGALLLSIGAIEAGPDFSWIDPDFAAVVNQASAFIPSLIGAALMVLSVAMSQRVALAWGTTIGLLLLAAAFTVAQGERFWIPGVLMLAAVLIAPFRSAFYRHARLVTGPLSATNVVPLAALVVCILALAAFEPHVRWLNNASFWEVILSRQVPNSLRATVAAAVVLALIAIWRLVRPTRVPWLPWNAEARLRYAALGAAPPAEADGIVWGESERAAIPFRRIGRVLLGLGDPAGAESDRVSTIWRLRDLAQQEGLDPAVWRAERGLLKAYGDIGLAALPLDRNGLPMAEDDDGRHPVARHYLVCVAERDLSALLPLLPELMRPEWIAAE